MSLICAEVVVCVVMTLHPSVSPRRSAVVMRRLPSTHAPSLPKECPPTTLCIKLCMAGALCYVQAVARAIAYSQGQSSGQRYRVPRTHLPTPSSLHHGTASGMLYVVCCSLQHPREPMTRLSAGHVGVACRGWGLQGATLARVNALGDTHGQGPRTGCIAYKTHSAQ